MYWGYSMGMLLLFGLPMLLIGGLLLDSFNLNDIVDRYTNGGTGNGNTDTTGNGGSDLTHTGTAQDDLMSGTSLTDAIYGLDGGDTISGLAGDDSLFGGTGSDSISGNSGGDLIEGGTGRDHLEGDSGADTIDGGGGADMIYGGRGVDLLSGAGGADSLFGSNGDDTLAGGDGADLLNGGSGNDLLEGGAGNDALYDSQGSDSLYGGADNDILVATRYGNQAGTDFAGDALFGGLGSDVLSGDAGLAVGAADTMTGGAGADYFEVMGGLPGAHAVVEPAVIADFTSIDSLLVHVPTQTGLSQVDLVAMPDGTEVQIDGVTYAMLLGNLNVSPDQVSFQGAAVSGTRIVGTESADNITANSAAVVGGVEPQDVVLGLGGNDTLTGAFGSVTLLGADGDDVLIGGTASDELVGGLGHDRIIGSSLDQGVGGAPDLIYGGFGDDTLFAGSNDTVTGGENADLFELFSTQENVVITDFTPGADRIEYTDPNNAVAQAVSVRAMVGGSEVLYGSIVIAQLQGVTPAQLVPARDITVTLRP